MSNNITPTYFLTLFDEFKCIPKTKLLAYISIATTRVPQSVWCGATQYATALLTAHMLSTAGTQGGGPAGGAVTAEQVGDLSRSFATLFVPGAGDAPFMTTRYGIDFIALRKETIVSIMPTVRPRARGWGPCW